MLVSSAVLPRTRFGAGRSRAKSSIVGPGIAGGGDQARQRRIVQILRSVDLFEIFPAKRRRCRQIVARPQRIGRHRGGAAGVAVEVDEDPPLAVRRSHHRGEGVRRALRRSRSAIAPVAACTAFQSSFGVTGTTTCTPLPPVVLAKADEPERRQLARARAPPPRPPRARRCPRRGRGRRPPGPPARGSPTRQPQVWNSTTPNCASAR